MAAEISAVIQVTNIAPVASIEQMTSLFSFMGEIKDLQLYPSETSGNQTSQICYVKYVDAVSALVAQHLTNTVFIDRALIVLPHAEDIPDVTTAQSTVSTSGASGGSNSGLISQVVPGIGGNQVISTMDPRLTALGLPQYPPLPANMDPAKVEEIRRTVYVGNLESTATAEQLLRFFNLIGEVKFVRMAGDENQPTRFAFIEFSEQSSVANALQYNGAIFSGRPLKINHSNNAIVKPQTKTTEAAQKEIEDAMKRVREAQSIIQAAIDPGFNNQSALNSGAATSGGIIDLAPKKLEEVLPLSTIASRRSRTGSRSRERRERSRSRRRSPSRNLRRSPSRDRIRRGWRSRSRERRRRERSPSRTRLERDRRRKRSPSRERRRRTPERLQSRDIERRRRSKSREKERDTRRTSRDTSTSLSRDRAREESRRERSRRERSPIANRARDNSVPRSTERRRRSKEKSPSIAAEGPVLPPPRAEGTKAEAGIKKESLSPRQESPSPDRSRKMKYDSPPNESPKSPAGEDMDIENPVTPDVRSRQEELNTSHTTTEGPVTPQRVASMSMSSGSQSPQPKPLPVEEEQSEDEQKVVERLRSPSPPVPSRPYRSKSREQAPRSVSRGRGDHDRHKRRKDKERNRDRSRSRDRGDRGDRKRSKKSRRDRSRDRNRDSKDKDTRVLPRDYDEEEKGYDSDVKRRSSP